MSKTKLKDQISTLLEACGYSKIVFYFNDSYHVIKDCTVIEIQKSEAVTYLSRGAEFWHLVENTWKFDPDSKQWTGNEPEHKTPEGLPACKIINISVPDNKDLMSFVNFICRLQSGASKNPKIAGFNYIIPQSIISIPDGIKCGNTGPYQR